MGPYGSMLYNVPKSLPRPLRSLARWLNCALAPFNPRSAWQGDIPTWFKAWFLIFLSGTPLILSGSQFYRICRWSCAKWSNMSRKMTSDLGRSCFDGFVHITCILQAFSAVSSLPQGLFFWPKGASQDFWTCIYQVLYIFIDFGVPGVPYCDF